MSKHNLINWISWFVDAALLLLLMNEILHFWFCFCLHCWCCCYFFVVCLLTMMINDIKFATKIWYTSITHSIHSCFCIYLIHRRRNKKMCEFSFVVILHCRVPTTPKDQQHIEEFFGKKQRHTNKKGQLNRIVFNTQHTLERER